MGDSHRDQSVDRLLKAELRRTGQDAIPAASEACVDAETFAAWSDGALPPARMSAIESHLADCARCQALMAVFARTETAAAAVAVVPVRQARPFRWLFPLAAGTVAATLIVWLARPAPPTSTPTETAPTTMIARADDKAAEAPPIAATRPPAPAPAATPAPAPAPASTALADQFNNDKKETAKLQTNERRDAASQRTEAKPQPPPLPVAQTKDVPARTVPLPRPPAQAPTAPPVAAPPPPPAQATAQPPARAGAVAAPTQSNAAITVDGLQRNSEFVARAAVVVEFSSADLQQVQQGQQGAAGAAGGRGGGGGGRGGGGAGGGRGGTVTSAAGATTATSTLSTAPIALPIRWRVLASGAVERSTANSTTWDPVKIDPPAYIESGAAPAPLVCWLVGRDGAVLVSTNADTFLRVNLPERVDVISVRATSARQATVTTRDNRTYTTVDGGQTWNR